MPIAKLYDDKGVLYLPSKQHPGAATACIGVLDAEPSYHVVLPFQVNLNSEGIVGPSAGLAFTLGLMQKLDSGNLTGGLKVAATGTMSVTGQIGAIGGIQQKTIAVRSSGASIFLVPPDNYAIAEEVRRLDAEGLRRVDHLAGAVGAGAVRGQSGEGHRFLIGASPLSPEREGTVLVCRACRKKPPSSRSRRAN